MNRHTRLRRGTVHLRCNPFRMARPHPGGDALLLMNLPAGKRGLFLIRPSLPIESWRVRFTRKVSGGKSGAPFWNTQQYHFNALSLLRIKLAISLRDDAQGEKGSKNDHASCVSYRTVLAQQAKKPQLIYRRPFTSTNDTLCP